jgi:hypothetical protein
MDKCAWDVVGTIANYIGMFEEGRTDAFRLDDEGSQIEVLRCRCSPNCPNWVSIGGFDGFSANLFGEGKWQNMRYSSRHYPVRLVSQRHKLAINAAFPC